MDALAQIPVVQGGAVALLFATLWLIFTGRLIPKSQVDSMREDRDKIIEAQREEIKEWRTAWQAADLTKRELASQLTDIMELGKVTVTLVRSIEAKGGQKP